MKEIAIKYSGGTDSTAAVALLAEKYDRITLLTYKHAGISHAENSRLNVETLKKRFGSEKFNHRIIDIDALYRLTTYADYWRFVRKFGLINLTTCGLCKLAMHLRTLMFCLENGIGEVADGANKNLKHFPDQMKEVIILYHRLYARFGIEYTNPVFDLEFPKEIDWIHKLGLPELAAPSKGAGSSSGKRTTGRVLFDLGILPQENVKGTPLDRKMQGRCFQLTLMNAFALGYFIPKYGMERYQEEVTKYFESKISYFEPLIRRTLEGDGHNPLARAIR